MVSCMYYHMQSQCIAVQAKLALAIMLYVLLIVYILLFL